MPCLDGDEPPTKEALRKLHVLRCTCAAEKVKALREVVKQLEKALDAALSKLLESGCARV